MSLPPIRRIVTGHDTQGRAVVTANDELPSRPNPSGDAQFTLIWTTATAPVDNDDATDGRDRAVGLTLPGGSVLRVVDFKPATRSPMHRTNSLDYGIVMSGTIELELDDGAFTLIHAGGIIVQRGTIHAWRNPSADEIARVAFVLLDATPATANGERLPDILPGASAEES